jgi:hypothetical protein
MSTWLKSGLSCLPRAIFRLFACSSCEPSIWLSTCMPPDDPTAWCALHGHVRVSGTHVYSVCYRSGTTTLEVRYRDGAMRSYGDVSERVFEALVAAHDADAMLIRAMLPQTGEET